MASPSPARQVNLPPLQFYTSADCKRWVEGLPITNAGESRKALAGQLEALQAAVLPALERLKILEALKEPVAYVQEETARRYTGKPLPLDSAETLAWSTTVDLWRHTHQNYQLCLQALLGGELALAPHAALVTLRGLHGLACVLFEHHRVYRQPPADVWRSLHELYAFAEERGIARIRVRDTFGGTEPDSSCAETYVLALLLHLANPWSLSIRQMTLVRSWLPQWLPLVGLSPQPAPASAIPPVVVDLAGDTAPAIASGTALSATLRHLDLEQLSRTLRQTINLLRQGQSCAALGLGTDARQPGAENLLMLLYVHWCRAGMARSEERLPATESGDVCFGMPDVYFHVNGGREFRQPGELTAREIQDIHTYGQILRVEHTASAPDGERLEHWHIVNHSASGFMCMLRQPDSTRRIAHNQLLAVRRAQGRRFYVGMVQWLRIEQDGALYCGIRLFPGAAQAVAIRPSNFNPAGATGHARAVLLPEVAAPATPATVLLPPGWFQSGRFIEIVSDRKQVAKLLTLLEKGSDFERATIAIG